MSKVMPGRRFCAPRMTVRQCFDHRFHLCPSNCHCKSKGRRCQSRCICRQKRQAQEKESMMFQSQKIRLFCKRVLGPAKSKENLQKSSDFATFKKRVLGVNPKMNPGSFYVARKNREKLEKHRISYRNPVFLWCECSYRTFQKTLSYQRFFGFQSCRFPCFYFTSRTGSA